MRLWVVVIFAALLWATLPGQSQQVHYIAIGGVLELDWTPTPEENRAILVAGGKTYDLPALTLPSGKVGALIPKVQPGTAALRYGGQTAVLEIEPAKFSRIQLWEGPGACEYPSTEKNDAISDDIRFNMERIEEKTAFPLPPEFAAASPSLPLQGSRPTSREVHGEGTMEVITAHPAPRAVMFSADKLLSTGPDQTVAGTTLTNLAYQGDLTKRYDLVFIGDGFDAADKQLFERKVNDIVDRLRTFAPFSSNFHSFNIWRVNTAANQTGITNANRRNEMGDVIQIPSPYKVYFYADRLVESLSRERICDTIASHGLKPDAIIVLANEYQPGGNRLKEFTFVTISPDMGSIITHELGHLVGGLGDEYDCNPCSPGATEDQVHVEDNLDAYPNIAKEADFKEGVGLDSNSKPKWQHVDFGPYRGAGGSKDIYYRPADQCHMRTRAAPFCVVCRKIIDDKLKQFTR